MQDKFNPNVTGMIYCACCARVTNHREILFTMPCKEHGADYIRDTRCSVCAICTETRVAIADDDVLGILVVAIAPASKIQLPFGNK